MNPRMGHSGVANMPLNQFEKNQRHTMTMRGAASARSRKRQGTGIYSDCSAFAGFSRAARVAGIVVARKVIAVISTVAIARISGSDARIA